MDKMPEYLKDKLRRYDRYVEKANKLYLEILDDFEDKGVIVENLIALGEWNEHPQTEALAYISNCEGSIEDNIKQIEEIYVYFMNLNNQIK